MSLERIVECVPNFSEGRDGKKIEAIACAIRSIQGLSLLDIDPGSATNRTVYSFAGSPEAVLAGALAGAKAAWDCIDMASHKGAHPRMGALDVCPFVPVSGVTMEECASLAARFGEALAAELGVPVYLYEKSARKPDRISLASIRSGEYEGLEAKLADPEWTPDFGPAAFVPRWGATATGAREFLVAFNVNLSTKDEKAAQDIARSIRESGRTVPDGKGGKVRVPGLLRAVRAIGWYVEEYACAQVSANLIDYKVTGLAEVFEAVKAEAEKRGLRVAGSELVGLVPLEAMRACGRHYAAKAGRSPGLPDAALVDIASQALGLNSVADFSASAKIVEWACRERGLLVGMSLEAFADAVSADTPAPGGGSVAALAGALGASLAAMVANLGARAGAESGRSAALGDLALKAQALKAELLGLVDADTAAFDAVLVAVRLPKSTEEERLARSAAVQAAYRGAAKVPLDAASACLGALGLCGKAVDLGKKSSVTDGAVGASMALAGVEGALLNVRINLASITDPDFRSACLAEVSRIRAQAAGIKASIDRTLEEVFLPEKL